MNHQSVSELTKKNDEFIAAGGGNVVRVSLGQSDGELRALANALDPRLVRVW